MKKRPSPTQLKAIADNYKQLRANVARAGQMVLEMVRHPDVTPEDITAATDSYKRSFQGLREIHESCRKNIGPNHDSHWKPYPWETPL